MGSASASASASAAPAPVAVASAKGRGLTAPGDPCPLEGCPIEAFSFVDVVIARGRAGVRKVGAHPAEGAREKGETRPPFFFFFFFFFFFTPLLPPLSTHTHTHKRPSPTT